MTPRNTPVDGFVFWRPTVLQGGRGMTPRNTFFYSYLVPREWDGFNEAAAGRRGIPEWDKSLRAPL